MARRRKLDVAGTWTSVLVTVSLACAPCFCYHMLLLMQDVAALNEVLEILRA